ncbi:MAG: hypothetical protein M5U15_08775 [Kiritimatiellae bacterium]|nr:hypothetical protein [Kiritimatiellia bacterium]
MKKINFQEALNQVIKDDPRFAEDAYVFLREALDFTVKLLDKPTEGPARHISGQELIQGIRQYALQEFGPLALRVLNTWGIHRTLDFGEMVYNLIRVGIMGKTDEDRVEDFANGFDFEDAFTKPFQPRRQTRAARAAGLN